MDNTNGLRDLLYSQARLEETQSLLQPTDPAYLIPEANRVLGVVAEIGYPHQVAIIIAGFANGDARVLSSKGGGLLGDLSQHPDIASAAKALVATALVATAQPLYTTLPIETDLPPLSPPDLVRFALLTKHERRVAQAPGPEIIQPGHPLHVIFTAMNNLVTQLQDLMDRMDSFPRQS